jgi:8-oxo-dGTP pyrophosphatase MutT (NUDIX family)
MIMGPRFVALPWLCRYGGGMHGPVMAEIDPRTRWIRSGWDRAIPTRFHIRTTVDGFDIRLLASVGDRGPGAIEVTVEQPQGAIGPPVTLNVLRKVTVDQIIRDALAQLARPASSAEADTGIPGTFRVKGVDGISGGRSAPAPGRGRDTPADRLVRVAEIYRAALSAARPPVKAVAEELPASRSTAGRLVGLARRAGLLSATTQGRTGADAETAPAVVAAIVTSRRGVLIGRRNDRTPPWTFIAGEQEPGELPEDTAVREVKEETGLEVRPGRIIGERDHPATGRHMIYMAATARGTKAIVGDEAELAEVKWASLAEADELLPGMYEPVHEYLRRELRKEG